MKIAALFVNRWKQAAMAQDLAIYAVDMVPTRDIAGLIYALRDSEVDAVILEDSALQLIDWLETLGMHTESLVPIIVIGGSGGIGMMEAISRGATDYVDYSTPVDQLLTRLQARTKLVTHNKQKLEVGPYELCSSSLAVFHDGIEINLTTREFALAWILFSNLGRVVSASRLAARVWGRTTDVCKRTLEQHIYRLRRKLSNGDKSPAIRLHAVYGVGYRLDLIKSDVPKTSFQTRPTFLESRI